MEASSEGIQYGGFIVYIGIGHEIEGCKPLGKKVVTLVLGLP